MFKTLLIILLTFRNSHYCQCLKKCSQDFISVIQHPQDPSCWNQHWASKGQLYKQTARAKCTKLVSVACQCCPSVISGSVQPAWKEHHHKGTRFIMFNATIQPIIKKYTVHASYKQNVVFLHNINTNRRLGHNLQHCLHDHHEAFSYI